MPYIHEVSFIAKYSPNLSAPQMAELIGCDVRTVRSYLARFSLPSKKRNPRTGDNTLRVIDYLEHTPEATTNQIAKALRLTYSTVYKIRQRNSL